MWLIVAQIYWWYCVWWGTKSLQYLVLDLVSIFYPILIPFPRTSILSIIVVVAAVYLYLVGSSHSSIFLVFALGSIPSLHQNHLEVFCVVLSLKRRLWCVPHLAQHWICVSSSYYRGGIDIRCGLHHIRMSINMRGYYSVSLY